MGYTMSTKIKIGIAVFAIACFAAGIGLYFILFQTAATDTTPTKTGIIGKPRPEFSLQDTSNNLHNIKEWDGKVILLNFWATWCPPCRREIPAFIDLYDKYRDKGFIIVGMALDSKQNAIDFVDPMGINYPILIGEQEGIALTQQYGNDLGVLPYSVIIDRHGIVRHTVRHELSQEQAEQLITPLL
jgi:peroxiredoxin